MENETQLIDDQFWTSSWSEISKSEIKFDLIGDGKTGSKCLIEIAALV